MTSQVQEKGSLGLGVGMVRGSGWLSHPGPETGFREPAEKSGCHARVVGLSLADSEEPLVFCAGKR